MGKEMNMEQLSLFDIEEIPQSEQKSLFDAEEYQSIVLMSSVKQDNYTNYIKEAFDLQITDTSKVCIPNKLNINQLGEWNIGVICGASGSGKSTILKHLAKECNSSIANSKFDNTKCLISNFDTMTPKEATLLLSQMGLSSVPTWIRPFNVLSNGEQYRASLAKAVSDSKEGEIIFVDEYTSVVDRNVAMAMSNALQKYIRMHNKRIILATCHYDIFDWLKPDWIYDLNKGGALEKGDYLRQPRPQIELQVYRTTCDTWERFKKYHYMTAELNEAATCFVFTWNEKLVAFNSIIPMPSGSYTNAWREHRLVVLPDFQGFGIGSKISEFTGAILKQANRIYYTKTINPALGLYRMKHKEKWKTTGKNLKVEPKEHIEKWNKLLGGLSRPSYCHKYIGQPMSGYEDLLLPANQMRYALATKNQMNLFV